MEGTRLAKKSTGFYLHSLGRIDLQVYPVSHKRIILLYGRGGPVLVENIRKHCNLQLLANFTLDGGNKSINSKVFFPLDYDL